MSIDKVEIQKNWCSEVDSPTYKLTWYIVKEEVFQDPRLLDNNGAVENKNAVIIASSGETMAYSVENLVMQSFITPGSKHGDTTTGIFQFDIYEPGGFQLLNRILSLSHSFGFANFQSARYVLKVELVGRKYNSNVPIKFDGVFYYPMLLSQINASAGPEGAQYNIVGANQHKIAQLSANIVTDIKINRITTVQTFFDGLTQALNSHEQNIRRKKIGHTVENAKTWKIEVDDSFKKYLNKSFVGTTDKKSSAPMQDPREGEKIQLILGKYQNVSTFIIDTITDRLPAYQDDLSIAMKEEQDVFEKNVDYRLRQAVNNKPSAFMFKDFVTVTPSIRYDGEIDPMTNKEKEIIVLTVALRKSYTTPSLDPEHQNSLMLNSTYQQQRFELLPIHKKYDYLYTGQNTEVLDFSLDFNQLFYLTRDPSAGEGYATVDNTFKPREAEPVTTQSTDKSSGVTNSSTVKKSDVTYLSDVKIDNGAVSTQIERLGYVAKTSSSNDQKNATTRQAQQAREQQMINAASFDYIMFEINIKGDPYWLGTPGSINTTTTSTTLFDGLNEDSLIIFVNYLPEDIADPTKKNKKTLDIASTGVYKIIEVESKFQQGKFTQTLKGMRDRSTSTDLIQNKITGLS